MRHNKRVLSGLLWLLLSATTGFAANESSLSRHITAQVRAHVEAGLTAAGLHGEITSIVLPVAAAQLPADSRVRPIRRFIPNRAAGRHIIPLEVTRPGAPSTKINVTVSTVAVIVGWTTAYAVKRRDALEPSQFTRKTIRVNGRESDYIQAEALPENYQLASTIKPGQLLKHFQIEPIPDVNSGDEVTIYFKYNTITLVSPGKARRRARVGETLPVVATATGKRFYGVLVSPAVVIVE
ncbi:MAG: flagellar basal body P-ring formation protein FlgA [Candidatus Marinimicrobia bacterium]|nr:flagellar basal body P-ring formation protein FlgA [Candidatus Neomarinimicrobiota bacterium]